MRFVAAHAYVMGLLFSAAVSVSAAAPYGQACGSPPLAGQRRDAVTIVRLERAWSLAYLRGDTAFERCLLTPDFTEIMRSGAVKGFADELGFAMKNIGRRAPMPDLPTPTVLIHGDAAVAFARVRGKAGAIVYADFYVWSGGTWRAYFAQQTPA